MTEGDDAEQSNTGRRRSLLNPFGRIVEAVVPNVMHAIDVDDVVAQIDIDDLLARVDIDALLARVDIDAVLARVDIDVLAARVDIDAVLARVDIDALAARVDIDAVLARVNVDDLLDRVDVEALAQRLDIDALVGRVDVNAVVGKVDMNGLLQRVDIDAVLDRVDVDHIMQRADIAGIVASSTRGITASTLDLARRQLAGIDELITRLAARVARRDPDADPNAPPALEGAAALTGPSHVGPSISGHYAGPLSRLASLSIDTVAVVFMFGVGTAIASWTIDLLFRGDGESTLSPAWSSALFVAWSLLYYIVPLAATGRTLGKAIIGLRVVTRDGHPLQVHQAIIRVVTLPLSFALLGLGLVGAVFGRRRRALHDIVAGSAEVIDWGDRAAALPSPISNWLTRRAAHAENATGAPTT